MKPSPGIDNTDLESHKTDRLGNRFLTHTLLVVAALFSASVPAQVQTDGTMGPAVTLSGQMVIDSELGTSVGANLFHSFTVFNIRTGESVTFTGWGFEPIENVIGRVSGPGLSVIDGLLACDIEGANLYLFNPNGIAFGRNAALDVQGSFTASTADSLVFADGQEFSATPDPISDFMLSVADPAGFGFLHENPAAITVSGSLLRAAAGQGVALVGGDLVLDGAKLVAEDGRLDLVSVGSSGRVELMTNAPMAIESFSRLGEVNLKGETELQASETFGPGGAIYIRGGRLLMDSSRISTSAVLGPPDPIDLAVSGDIILGGGSEIISESLVEGRGSDILLNAGGDITLSDGSKVTSNTIGFEGKGGGIVIDAEGSLLVQDGSRITAETNFGGADGGDITINLGGDLTVTGDSWVKSETLLASGFFEAGDAGNIEITARNVEVSNAGRIFTSSVLSAPGRAGDISIQASGNISIIASSGESLTGISSNPDEIDWDLENPAKGIGGAGNIKLEAGALTMSGGFVSTRNDSDAATGNIEVRVQSMDLAGGAYLSASTTGGFGDGGKLTILVDESASLSGNSRLESGSRSAGDGGLITVSAQALNLEDSWIDSSASGSGNAGDIEITVSAIELQDSTIQTSAEESAGGNITIEAGEFLQFLNSTVSASANSVTPQDNGGNLTIETPEFLILNLSEVLARANAGNGGNIRLAATYFVQSGDSLINASSKRGIDGQIQIESPNDVTGTVYVPEMPSLDLSALLQERCAAAALGERSSFTIDGGGGLPARPGGYLTSPNDRSGSIAPAATGGKDRQPKGTK